MSSRIGADIGQLQNLASTFSSKSAEVNDLVATITSQFNATWWEGPARTNFASTWDGMVPQLKNLVEALSDCSREASSRASAIQAAGS